MTHYVVTVELDAKPDEDVTDWIVESLQPWHAVAIGCQSGNAGAIMTLPAENLEQAVATAYRLVEPHHRIVALSVIDEATRDKREGWEPNPELLSVTEVAVRLGITRTAVQKRIDHGSLPARRVGSGWAIPESAVR